MKQKWLLVSLVILIFPLIVTGQNLPIGKYTLFFKPLQLLVQEVPISIEKSVNNNAFGLLLGYRFTSKWDQNTNGIFYNNNTKGQKVHYSVSDFQAITIGATFRHYFREKSQGLYSFNTELFYRHWWDNGEEILNFGGMKDVVVTFKDRTNVYGLKFVASHISQLSKKGRIRMVLDKYVGVSVRYRKNEFSESGFPSSTIYSYGYNQIPAKDNLVGGFHLGISLGFSFYPKPNSKD